MKKHIVAFALIVAIGTGITMSKTNAYAKTKHSPTIQQTWQDGNPVPLCPPPPYPCR
jgi:hypothetical protein